MSKIIPYGFLFSCVTIALIVVSVFAETPGVEDCSGLLFRSKKEGIPVYASPDKTSKVLRKLSLGEKVCRVGEMGEFQILKWKAHSVEDETGVSESSSAFARTVDLWEARDMPGKKPGVFESAYRFFKLLFSGGMADDPLLPYRPVMDPEKSIPQYSDSKSSTETSQEDSCQQ